MKRKDFADSPSGRTVPTERGQFAFVPYPLPPDLDPRTYIANLEPAARAVGELDGIGRTLENPFLLIRPMQIAEALTSSSMEGTYTTLDDLLLFEAGATEKSLITDTREVANYRLALSNAINSLKDLPLCIRTLRDAHRDLLGGVGRSRGGNKQPGELKTSQNFIGALVIEEARFIPPPPDDSRQALSDLEQFVQRAERGSISTLVEAALIHYQFETIHPFADGNGRVGRMLITLHLYARGAIRQPMLYLSPYFEAHKDAYIDHMFEVSKTGAWDPWIRFFLRAVEASARRSIAVADELFALQRSYRATLQKTGRSANLPKIADNLFVEPVFTIPRIAEVLGVTYRAAMLNVEQMIDVGIIDEVSGTSNPKYFVAKGVLNIIRTGSMVDDS